LIKINVMVRSAPGPRGPARRYRRDDLERLRARRAARAGAGLLGSALRWGEPLLESAVTRMTQAGPVYRGHALEELVRGRAPFEGVAELLWSGRLPEPRAAPDPAWSQADFGVPLKRLAALLPAGATPLAALQLAVPALAAADPGRFDTRREAVLPRARALIRRMAAALALAFDPGRVASALRAASVAESAAVALGARGARAVQGIERALVVCADHELNASTFAARVVASTRADLYAAAGAALAALSGPRHGAVSEQVEALLVEIGRPERAERVMHQRLRRGEPIPGFGHPFYAGGDPRAQLLLEIAGEPAPRSQSARTLAALIEAAAAARRPPPNLDLGLVAVTAPLGLPPGAAAGLFAVGRCAGWVAHILEQYETGFLLRPRARYAGEDTRRSSD
jgi:citrate synthase